MSDDQDTDTSLTEDGEGRAGAELLPKDLLDLLVCPIGKKPLRVEGDLLVCTECGAGFRVTDGIPNMLIEEAVLPEGIRDAKELRCHTEDK